MSSTTTVSHPSFSIPLFTQLVQRLRHTNAQYNQIAHQCRRTQRPTHHAKRRAYRAGLRIDTSKIISAASIQLLPVLDTASSPMWVATETETELRGGDSDSSVGDAYTPCLGLALRNFLPEVVVQMQPATLCYLSPPQLGSNVNVDESDACNVPFPGPVPVPGAPRWRSIPLPEDECGMEATTFGTPVSYTYDPNVWQGVTVAATHVSDAVSTEVDVVCASLGITVSPRHLKRTM